jgi:hypothetical protein
MESNKISKEFTEQLLSKMNTKAMLIIQIEETLSKIKLPIDKDFLYQMQEKDLVEFLEMLAMIEKNRKKFVNDETNG